MRIILLIVISNIFYNVVSAQDAIFSQPFAAHTTLNPALIGVFESKYRAKLNYRDQYYSVAEEYSFKTINASFDYKLTMQDDYFTFGADIFEDWSGATKYNIFNGHLSASYTKKLGGSFSRGPDQSIMAGTQVGIGANSLKSNDLWFGRQFDLNNYAINTGLDSGEMIPDGREGSGIYPDLNVGVFYYAMMQRRDALFAGISMYHITGNQISTLSNRGDRLFRRVSIQAGGQKTINRDITLHPYLVFNIQGPLYHLHIGSSVGYRFNDLGDSGMRIGAFLNMVNSIDGVSMSGLVITSRYDNPYFSIAASYDFTISSLKLYNNNLGGFELNFTYLDPFNITSKQRITPDL